MKFLQKLMRKMPCRSTTATPQRATSVVRPSKIKPHRTNRLRFKFAEADAVPGAKRTAEEYSWLGSRWIDCRRQPKGRAERERASQRIIIRDDASTAATPQRATSVEFKTKSAAFTLFEVLIALAVFAFAITGLVMALDSLVHALLETRQHVFSRLGLESRLAYNLVDPPLSGERTLTNNGIIYTESLAPVNLTDGNGNEITSIYRLKISSECGKTTDSAETLLFIPQ